MLLADHPFARDNGSNSVTRPCMRPQLPEGVSGCRAEFYTNTRLKKCGVVVGKEKAHSGD